MKEFHRTDEVIVLCIGKNLYTCIYMDLGSFDQKLAKNGDSHEGSLDDKDMHNKYSVPPWYDQVKDISKKIASLLESTNTVVVSRPRCTSLPCSCKCEHNDGSLSPQLLFTPRYLHSRLEPSGMTIGRAPSLLFFQS